MRDKEDLSEALESLLPEVAARVARHFKDGVFEFDLNADRYTVIEGNTVYHVIPHFAEDDSESVVSKLRSIMARELEKSE